MTVGYMVGTAMGFFFIYFSLMMFALFYSKFKAGWILYGIAGGYQLLSMIGNQIRVTREGHPGAMFLYWIFYVVTMIGLFALIYAIRNEKIKIKRKKKDQKKDQKK